MSKRRGEARGSDLTRTLARHRLCAVALLAGGAVGCSEGWTARVGTDWASVLSLTSCGEEVSELLDEWNGAPEILHGAPDAGGSPQVRIPTDVIGEWIVFERSGLGSTLSRVGRDRTDAVTFDDTCARRRAAPISGVGVGERARGSSPSFTDADLRDVVASSDRPTLVYVWSPHMPLSVDGYAEIAAASRSLDVMLVPVLFSESEPGFAAREAARGEIPAAGLREARSVELVFRDALVHAPSLLVFDRGQVSPVLPGYRNAAGYRRYLEGVLSRDAGTPP